MNTYILVGETAVRNFENQDWKELGELIGTIDGDIIAFDNATEHISELLERLKGWNDFIELTFEDLQLIKQNTKIEIQESKKESFKLPIYWSVEDFEGVADRLFCELQNDNPKEFENFNNWEQFYDKSLFPQMLEQMIKNHDANEGITWQTIEFYVGLCEIKN